MPFVSITRLRVRRWRFMPAFLLDTIRTRAQVRAAPGFLGGALLADRRRTFWTLTLWRDQADMRAYMVTGAHRTAMPKLLGWCDQASVVHWTQDAAGLPDWHEADRRMRTDGRPSKVRHPAAGHADLGFDPPRTAVPAPLTPRPRR